MDDLGFFRIEQSFVTRSPLTTAGGAAAYQSGERFRCVLAAAAYQAGSCEAIDPAVRAMVTKQGLSLGPDTVFDYSGKRGVYASEIRHPSDAPAWCRQRSTLWGRVEAAERRRDAALALRYEAALSRTVPIDLSVRHLNGFVDRHLVARGLVVDTAIHLYGKPLDPRIPEAADQLARTIDPAWPILPVARVPNRPPVNGPHVLELPDGRLLVYQPHAHILASTRPLDGDGFGKKDRALWKRSFLIAARQGWEEACNAALHESGSALRVSQKSKWRRQRESGTAAADDRLLCQVPLGPAYHAVMGGRAAARGEHVMAHDWNAIVGELAQSRRLTPETQAARLAVALARIIQLEQKGVRFSVGPARTLRIEAPDGVVVGWQDRALWSGLQGAVADFLDARGQTGAEITVNQPAQPDTDSADEMQRLRASLEAVDAAVTLIATKTNQQNKPMVSSGDWGERVLTVARGAMAYAHSQKGSALLRERQARLAAAEGERLQAGRVTALERALEQGREERRLTEQSLAALRREREDDRHRTATLEESLHQAKLAAIAAGQRHTDLQHQHERSRGVLERVRTVLGGQIPDDRLVDTVVAVRQRADGIAADRDAAMAESGPSAKAERPVLAGIDVKTEPDRDAMVGWLDAQVRILGFELQGPPAVRIPQAIAILEAALSGRAAELERLRRERDQARVEAEGWRRAFWMLVRHAEQLLVKVGLSSGLGVWAKTAWRGLVAMVQPDRPPVAAGPVQSAGHPRSAPAAELGDTLSHPAPVAVENAAGRRATARRLQAVDRMTALADSTDEPGWSAISRILTGAESPIGVVDGGLRLAGRSAVAIAALEAKLATLDDRQLAACARATDDGVRLTDDPRLRLEYERASAVIDGAIERRRREWAPAAPAPGPKTPVPVADRPLDAIAPSPSPPSPPPVRERPPRVREDRER
ncbi:MobA/MobL family protein [Roseomonas genomospecies 6]|uniref:MobA/MobL family protein n=1 Tax=Roseomonas genomospecies 6 TaxID=214106 RepID=UPI00142EF3F7|nr:MobA/MobL family protein [Roseomonas genomospecies 6]